MTSLRSIRKVLLSLRSNSVVLPLMNDAGIAIADVSSFQEASQIFSDERESIFILELPETDEYLSVLLRDYACNPGLWDIPTMIVHDEGRDVDVTTIFQLNSHVRIVGVQSTCSDSDSPFARFLKEIIGTPSPLEKLIDQELSLTTRSGSISEHLFFGDEATFESGLRGGEYIRLSKVSSDSVEWALPQELDNRELIEDILESASYWERHHFFRIAFLSATVLRSVGIRRELLEIAAVSSFFFLWPSSMDDRRISRTPLFKRRKMLPMRQRFVDLLRQNANEVESQLGEEALASVVRSMANTLDCKQAYDNVEYHFIGSTIAIADIVDRECYYDGAFNPFGVYTVMRWLEDGNYSQFDIRIIQKILIILIDAVQASPPRPAAQRVNPNLPKDVSQIQFRALRPGMRLAENLTLSSGRVVLKQGVVLDADLIWRLWRISTLTELFLPVIKL